MENENPLGTQPTLADLQEECSWLRKQLSVVLFLTVLLAASLNIYLLYQLKVVRAELNVLQPQAAPMAEQARQIMEIVGRFSDYGKTHPDFGPILVKYGLASNAAPAIAAPPAKK